MSMSVDSSTLENDPSVYNDPAQNVNATSPQQRRFLMPSITMDGPRPTVSNATHSSSSPLQPQCLPKQILEECTAWRISQIRRSLRMAAMELNHRGLKLASKWASEQLMGLQGSDIENTSASDAIDEDKDWDEDDDTEQIFPGLNHMTNREIYAKSLFDLGEYLHAVFILSSPLLVAKKTLNLEDKYEKSKVSSSSSHMNDRVTAATATVVPLSSDKEGNGDFMIHPPRGNLTSFGIYLRAYALYLAGEKRKEEEYVELSDSLERTALRNPYLPQLALELGDFFKHQRLDVFGIYIYGIVLKELQKNTIGLSEYGTDITKPTSATHSPRTTVWMSQGGRPHPSAHVVLICSLMNFPYNWSAWLDIAELCINDATVRSEVERLLAPLSNHWMYYFFCIHLFLEDQGNENALILIERLAQGILFTEEDGSTYNRSENGLFTQSLYLQSQMAVAYYNLRDFDVSQSHFLAISQQDPLRLDHLDVFSNILYVKEDRVTLSQLAHRAVRIEKYRPETCCIVGNYYSIKAQHEKAVQYFQRALKLDRTYLSAWTLMGHEYIEMKNSAAAVEAYRRAVDINPRDYRAWYGLGQTYEIMNMLLYSLFYYKKAVELRPYDARMWCAMGGCYLALERRTEAIRSFERAVSNNDTEGIATRKLAELYREDGDLEQAARCYLRHLELRYRLQQSTHSLDVGVNLFEHVINSVNVDAPEAEALLYLANYYRDHGEYELATMACSRLLDYPGPEKEEGKALLREIRSRMDSRSKVGGKTMTAKSSTAESFDFSP